MNKEEKKANQLKYISDNEDKLRANGKKYLETQRKVKWWELSPDQKNEWINGKHKKVKDQISKIPRVSEYPIKAEQDLGCFPQLPLLAIERFKKIQFE